MNIRWTKIANNIEKLTKYTNNEQVDSMIFGANLSKNFELLQSI